MLNEILCTGRTCLVVGSAPNFAMPKAPYDVCIVANGASALVDGDVLVTTSHLFRDGCTELEMSTRERMANRHFASVWLDVKCGNADVASRAMHDRYGITWESISFVNETSREEVVRAIEQVHPAAQIPMLAKAAGTVVCELNLVPSLAGAFVHHRLLGSVGETLPALVEAVRRRAH